MNKKHMLVGILAAAFGLIPITTLGLTTSPTSSINLRPPSTVPQTQVPTTTGAQSKTILPFVNGQSIPNQTCPGGYALTQVGYVAAWYTTSVCTQYQRYASGCDEGCNVWCLGFCCEGAPGYYLQDDDSCTEYSSRCVAWTQVWTPSSNILDNNSVSYMAGQFNCHQIINEWKKYVPPPP